MGLDEKASAWKLLGETVGTGWYVTKAVGWDPKTGNPLDIYNGTGGHFSVAYIVEKENRSAFLKAIDFSSVIDSQDVMAELHKITAAHEFEAGILKICAGNNMDKVVVAIESGQTKLGPSLQETVPFLIFELAEGDVRRRIQKVDGKFRLAWWLRAMHHTAIGLNQLHSSRIAHQDLKPSNVLSFNESKDFKVADLGRCIRDGAPVAHDEFLFPGDISYAPPEILYGNLPLDWNNRRLGTDIYLLGSLIFFFACGMSCTTMLASKIDAQLRPPLLNGPWQGKYSEILPMLQTIFSEMLDTLHLSLEPSVVSELVKAASELCSPDPELRGHPLERASSSNNFTLRRYISLFDKLATRAEIVSRRNKK